MTPTKKRLGQVHRACLAAALALAALVPSTASAWWNDEWTGRKQFSVDASAAGANVTEPIGPAVVLVRLHSGNFKLDAAKEDGSDLRFVAEDDKTPLKFHLEKFDPLLGEALAWVALPDVKPGARTSFWIYYGNPKAAPAEDMKGTFDPGTALVYHFTEKDAPPRDSSPWGNQATTAAKAAEGALIGRGLRLEGTPVVVPAGASLAWAAGAPMTWSLWVRPSAASQAGVLFARREEDRAFVVGLDAGKPYAEVRGPSGVVRAAATSTLAAASWHQVAVTAGPQGIAIWVDGAVEGRAQATLPALGTVALVGGDAPGAAALATPPRPAGGKAAKAESAAPAPPFVGDVDELEIAKVERPPGLLKLAAIAQGMDPGKLVVAGAEEEGSSFSSGYMAIILRSVTPDGWVVIGLLAIMAIVSWMVMVGKSSYLSKVHGGNEAFLERFRAATGELARFVEQTRQLPPAETRAFGSAPLLRIFQAGAEEIRKRSDGTRALHVEAIEAIRATLDAALVRENLRVQSSMVLLTIAISGGPFLGLLGTVVGVMITFASIAAAGDVNVNAIAPGIAAALVATVAGLAVAIPALFGYNWLLTRAKSTSAVMQVFVDEMITKIAEAYSERTITERRGPHLARVD